MGVGEGATANLPLPGLSGDATSARVFEEFIVPAATRFAPDIILVSAGYDSHWKDPLAGLQYCSTTYHRLCSDLKALAAALCSGRIVFLLEGGYDLEALSHSVAESFRGLLDAPSAGRRLDPDRSALQDEPTDKVKRMLREARAIHSLAS